MLTPEQIAEMDSITGLKQAPTISGADRVKELQSLRGKQGGLRGRFFETVEDIRDIGKNVSSTVKEGSKKVSESIDRYSRGEQRLSDTALQAIGSGASTVANVAGDVITGGAKTLVPQSVEDVVETGIEKITAPISRSKKVQNLIQRYEELKQNDPVTAANIESALGIAELASEFIGGKAGKQAVKKTIDAAQTASKVAKKGAELAGDTSKFLVGKTSGLSPETITYLFNNPEDYATAVRTGVTRAGVADDFFTTVQTKLDEVAETGSQYDPIRNSGSVVTFDTNPIQKAIESKGFSIVDGKIVPGTKSATRNTGQITELQKLYDNWGNITELDAEEFLNMRRDIGELSKFDSTGQKVQVDEAIARDIYSSVNQYGDQIPGLRELDDQFAPMKKEIEAIKKEFLTKDADGNWQLKDTAINRIINAKGAGKDKLIARLESYMPGISEKIRVAKVLEDIEYAKGRNVGAYLQGGSIYAGISTGNIPLAIAGIVVSSPTIMTKILTYSGIAKQVADDITNKIIKGVKLTIDENKILKKSLDSINKDNISTVLGVTLGVETAEQLSGDSTSNSEY